MALRTNLQRTGNRILDRLPQDERSRLLSAMEVVSPPQGHQIYRQDGPVSHVYFPTSGVFSLVIPLEQGREVKAATVGNEGMVGAPAVLGLDFSPVTAASQVSGECFRLPTSVLTRAMGAGGSLVRLLHRYTAFLLGNALQTAACNALHSVEERTCRWLLTTQDRLGNGELTLTHEFLAEMLGARRQTVTVIARTLQAANLISYRRGSVRILDREGLEAASCECYGVTKALYDRVMNN